MHLAARDPCFYGILWKACIQAKIAKIFFLTYRVPFLNFPAQVSTSKESPPPTSFGALLLAILRND